MKLDICIYSPYMTKYYILLNNKKIIHEHDFLSHSMLQAKMNQ